MIKCVTTNGQSITLYHSYKQKYLKITTFLLLRKREVKFVKRELKIKHGGNMQEDEGRINQDTERGVKTLD